MAELGPPGVKSTGLWVYDGLRGMRDPPMACAGLGKARGGGFDGGGSSARRRSPERTRWAALGFGSGCWGFCVRAQIQSTPRQGSCGAMCHCSMLATARLRCERWQSDGERRSGLGKCLRATTPSAKGREGRAGAHLGSNSSGVAVQGCWRRSPAGRSSGSARAALEVGDVGVELRVSGSRGSTPDGSVKVQRGSGRREVHRWRAIAVADRAHLS